MNEKLDGVRAEQCNQSKLVEEMKKKNAAKTLKESVTPCCLLSNERSSILKQTCSGLVVKLLNSQSMGPMFKTTGWL